MAHDVQAETYSKTILGFWLYLMTDALLFGTLFAVYGVLVNNTHGGPGGKELFHLPLNLAETLTLLVSSFTCGMASQAGKRGSRSGVTWWLMITFILGICFLWMEMAEFNTLIASGNGWQRSAFLSAFFTLVGTHGLHITFGLLWLTVLFCQMFKRGLSPSVMRRLSCFRLFWQFSYIVWVFVFITVYLMGVS
ncbi:MAG: Cytochrome bo(3) ubiquinol oxidase subunit 3 [Chlamydiia bacterium]|nr:Cytochrome bo(3) ubiquinol oxidase subunit 3 [Chlamydiia bacterium]MCH9615326.1 Cytochrome bo(3) ubiquinol oxidase subunit 3 [Chlamydiia bacterium]MCH9628352.1 Cytochrome bo(3) ubiquinol oxidase subunit 3 [Chlamydiia bacterium]